MNSVLLQFHSQLVELAKLLNYYEMEKQLNEESILDDADPGKALLFRLSQQFKSFSVSKREFNYNSLIISLYGYFERFIEEIIIDYAYQLNAAVKLYSKLPIRIAEKHYALSLELLGKLDQARYAGRINKEGIIEKLHACLSDAEGYKFIIDALTQHSANFKTEVIDKCFTNLDIIGINSEILKDGVFNQYTRERLNLGVTDMLSTEAAFEIINDLAQRRNDVAHGVSGDILQSTIILDYITFFHFYTDALVRVCNESLAKYVMDEEIEPLGEIKELFNNGLSPCLNTKGVAVKIGDTLTAVSAVKTTKLKILEIRVDNKPVEEISEGDDQYIGLLLDMKVKKNFILNKLTLKPKS